MKCHLRLLNDNFTLYWAFPAQSTSKYTLFFQHLKRNIHIMTNKKVQDDIYLSTERTKESVQYHIILPIILGDIIKTTPNRQEKVLCIIVLVKWM